MKVENSRQNLVIFLLCYRDSIHMDEITCMTYSEGQMSAKKQLN